MVLQNQSLRGDELTQELRMLEPMVRLATLRDLLHLILTVGNRCWQASQNGAGAVSKVVL